VTTGGHCLRAEPQFDPRRGLRGGAGVVKSAKLAESVVADPPIFELNHDEQTAYLFYAAYAAGGNTKQRNDTSNTVT
jgi:hypothetical protein